MRGRVYPGSTVVHGSSCTCPLPKCDPEQLKVKAAREAAARAPRPPTPPPRPTAARPVRRLYVVTDDTRRLQQLLREGRTFAQAMEVIEAEKHQRPEVP